MNQLTARTAANLPKGTQFVMELDEGVWKAPRGAVMVDEIGIRVRGEQDSIEFHKLPHESGRMYKLGSTLEKLGWRLVSEVEYIAGRRVWAFVERIEGVPEATEDKVAEAARHGETNKLHRATCMSQGDCVSHSIKDGRGGRGLELGVIPTCEPGITYGAWSEGAGGFVYSGDCATEVANWAADELRQLAKDDDTDTIQILAMCPDHDEQPKDGCEECGSEGDDADDEHEAEQDAGPSLDDYAKASRIIQSLIPRGRR